MRILMLAQFYWPVVGGEETHVHTLSTALAQLGHEVSVVTLARTDAPFFEIENGVQIHRVRSTTQRLTWIYSEVDRTHVPPFPDPELTRAIQRIVADKKPEIVHAHNWILHSFLPIKPFSDAKLVVSLHDYSFTCANKRLMQCGKPCSGPGPIKCLACAREYFGNLKGVTTVAGNWLMGNVERALVDMFLPVSQAVAEGNRLPELGLPYQVIPNFLHFDEESQVDKYDSYLAQLPNGPFLLFVGDVIAQKGVDVLLEAYGLCNNVPPLVLIGRKLHVGSTVPPNVVMLDRWPHGAVMQAWSRSLFSLVPSIWMEPFGIVAIEAMAQGRPVIASRIGGLADVVVHEQTGLLVPPGDVQALKQAIERLCTDDALRTKLGQAAQQHVQAYSTQSVVARLEGVYKSLVSSTRLAHSTQL